MRVESCGGGTPRVLVPPLAYFAGAPTAAPANIRASCSHRLGCPQQQCPDAAPALSSSVPVGCMSSSPPTLPATTDSGEVPVSTPLVRQRVRRRRSCSLARLQLSSSGPRLEALLAVVQMSLKAERPARQASGMTTRSKRHGSPRSEPIEDDGGGTLGASRATADPAAGCAPQILL